MEYDKMSNDQLAWVMAEKRGCAPRVGMDNSGQVVWCPCPSSMHGSNPFGQRPSLQKFPRDVMIGFLKSKEPAPKPKPDPEGMTVCRFIVNLRGQIEMRVTRLPQFEHYSFMVLMRGAAAEMDDHYEGECRYFSKTKDRFERDVDDMMGGADGVGCPGS